VSVPPQYFQSIIALELAITGALLWQIRYFEHTTPDSDRRDRPLPHPIVRVAVAIVLSVTLLGSLLGIVRGGGIGVAIGVAIGLAISLLPILLRVLPPLTRGTDGHSRDPHAVVTAASLFAYVVLITVFTVLLGSSD
jgi:hypothetical protein